MEFITTYAEISPSILIRHKRRMTDPIMDRDNLILYSSGRAAVYSAVKALNLCQGDVILAPSYHCGVEIEAMLKAGAKVRYYEILPNMLVDIRDLKNKIDPDVKAVFLIHYWGFPQPIDKIKKICRDENIYLIEDCAHALYSSLGARFLGTIGDMGIYSLRKTLPMPNGGALLVNNPELRPKSPFRYFDKTLIKITVKSLILSGCGKGSRAALLLLALANRFKAEAGPPLSEEEMTFEEESNYREVKIFQYNHSACSISLYLLKRFSLEKIRSCRVNNYKSLLRELSDFNKIEICFQEIHDGICPLFFPVFVEGREALQHYLQEKNIFTYVFGKYPHKSMKGPYTNARRFSNHILGLPVHQDLGSEAMKYLTQAITSCPF